MFIKKFLKIKYFIIVVLIIAGINLFSNREKLINSFEVGVGLERPEDTSDSCSTGYIFSQKECKCVPDSYRCKGLDKSSCEKKQNCYSYQRSGSCNCPSCLNMLDHQCLPIDDLLN